MIRLKCLQSGNEMIKFSGNPAPAGRHSIEQRSRRYTRVLFGPVELMTQMKVTFT